MIDFRPYTEADADPVLRLNAESVAVLSPMNYHRLRLLSAMADMHHVAVGPDGVVGFLMAFGDEREYDSVNYRWYTSRFKRFLYIDRVVVSPSCRGAGLGRRFYQHAEQHAASVGLAWLVCEVDVEPPNSVSLAFHDRLGFVEVGRQVADGGKVVSLRARNIA